jgi:hypothetical protein
MDKDYRFLARIFYNVFKIDTLYICRFNVAVNLFVRFKDGVGTPITVS